MIASASLAWQDSTGQGEVVMVKETPLPPETISAQDQAAIDQFHKALQATAEAEATKTTPIIMSGPTTTGSTIIIAGKEVKLLPNVQVEAFVAFGICEKPCDRPAYVLRNNDTGTLIAIGIATGLVQENSDLTVEQDRQRRSEFKWLIDAIGKEQ
jgi:hypothetical protein